MAEKGFGVKEVNLIGASGTPTITSPNNLNLNAVNVAISTNATVGGTLSVTGNVSVGGTLTYEDVTNIDSIGIITARDHVVVGGGLSVVGISTLSNIVKIMSGLDLQTNGTLDIIGSTSSSGLDIQSNASVQIGQNGFPNRDYATFTDTGVNLNYSGSTKLATTNTGVNVTGAITVNGSALSITPTNSDIQVAYTVTANGSSAYRFAGNGVVSTADNPDLYLIRGQKYRFINNSGGSHPFQIREASGGTAYSTGVTNNGASSGNIDFAPTYDSPAQLVYQCTSHGGMVGNIYLRDAAGGNTNVGVVTATAFVPTNQNLSHRNKIINGSMRIFQRGTSEQRSGGNDGYYNGIADRWAIRMHSSVAQTGFSQDTSDNPAGFGSNQKSVRSNAGSSNVGKYFVYDTKLEGQDLQDFAKGTSSAKEFTLSFYVKTGVSGVYCIEMRDLDNSRMVGGTYTVSNGNWNRYVITFPADTTGKFNNDNGGSLWVRFWLAAGSNFTSGTARTAWAGSISDSVLAVGQTAQVGDNVADTWQLTGVQLEVGPVATPFEHRSTGEELARCQRYYEGVYMTDGTAAMKAYASYGGSSNFEYQFKVEKRARPTWSLEGNASWAGATPSAFESKSGCLFQHNGGTLFALSDGADDLCGSFSAEL